MAALRRLEFGLPSDKSALALRFGLEKGFFRDAGVDLVIRVVFGGPPLAAAYDSGELAIGQMGSPPAVAALSRGARFKIVGGGLRRKAQMYLCVRRGLRDFDDLRGGRVGLLSRGSCDEWFCRVLFQRAGLDPDRDVTFVALEDAYPRTLALLEDGTIDAALAIEPNVSMGEAAGVLNVWTAVHEEDGLQPFQWIVRVANEGVIAREPDLVRAVLGACRRSGHYAAANTGEWGDFLAERYDMAPAIAARVIERELPHMHLDGGIDEAGLDASIAIQSELGAVSGSLKAADILDLRFVEG